MQVITKKVLIPLGISLFSAGASAGSIFLFKNKGEEHPNLVTFYKKNNSGELNIGDNLKNQSPKGAVSLGEKGWQYGKQSSSTIGNNKNSFQLKGKVDSMKQEELTNNKGLNKNDSSGSVIVYFSSSTCDDLNEKFQTIDSNSKEIFKLDKDGKAMKIFDNGKGFVLWGCTHKINLTLPK